jgi:hypothetical protein
LREHFGRAFHWQTDHVRKRTFDRLDNTLASTLRGVSTGFVDRIHDAKVIGDGALVQLVETDFRDLSEADLLL